jgi:cytochrome c oxidase subunit I+III
VLIIAPGIALFIFNLIYTHLRGKKAEANPWGGDSLEWALPSPPPAHGYSIPPIVESRHPLWDQESLHQGEEHVADFTRGLGRWPLKWRAVLVTTTTDARPEEAFRVSNPSIWPLIAAIGTVIIFAAELMKVRILALGGALVLIFAVIRWNWPEPADITEEEEEEFEAEHGIPVHTGGSPTISRWGMGLVILFVSIAFGSLLLSYFYLLIENPEWPPNGVAMPEISQWVLGSALIVASAIAIRAGLRGIVAGDRARLRFGLAGGLLIGSTAVVLQVMHLTGLELGATDHAYGSIFYTLSGFLVSVAGAGVITAGLAIYWAWRGEFSSRRHVVIHNIARYWVAMTALWVIGFGAIALVPYFR